MTAQAWAREVRALLAVALAGLLAAGYLVGFKRAEGEGIRALAIAETGYRADLEARDLEVAKLSRRVENLYRNLVKDYRPVVIRGLASWYGPGFHGRPTASLEIFDKDALTVAHKELPLGTTVLIVNLHNFRVSLATVNDRGPYVEGRVLDASEEIARRLDMVRAGVVPVLVLPLWSRIKEKGGGE